MAAYSPNYYFKTLCFIHCVLYSNSHCYISKRFLKYTPARILLSLSSVSLYISCFHIARFGRRTFSLQAALAWNTLPKYVQCTPNHLTIRKGLKTRLFHKYNASHLESSLTLEQGDCSLMVR